jgi:hypothetical protein
MNPPDAQQSQSERGAPEEGISRGEKEASAPENHACYLELAHKPDLLIGKKRIGL